MYADVSILAQENKDTLLVPRSAIIQLQGRPVVYVIKDDIAQQREVTTGLTDESRVEVLSGVTAGEDVVVAGQANLSNGAKVSAAKDK